MARPSDRTTAYEEHRPTVLGVLARRCSWLDPSDREAMFHDAYAVLLEKERSGRLGAMSPPQVCAYLVQTSLYRALDESRRADRRRSAPLGEEAMFLPDPGGPLEELVARRIDSEAVREIVGELPERRQIVVKLRFFFDRTPAEIQRFLGITERTYRKELERGLKQVAAAIEDHDGMTVPADRRRPPCERGRSSCRSRLRRPAARALPRTT